MCWNLCVIYDSSLSIMVQHEHILLLLNITIFIGYVINYYHCLEMRFSSLYCDHYMCIQKERCMYVCIYGKHCIVN
jgi:hypothetical protein